MDEAKKLNDVRTLEEVRNRIIGERHKIFWSSHPDRVRLLRTYTEQIGILDRVMDEVLREGSNR